MPLSRSVRLEHPFRPNPGKEYDLKKIYLVKKDPAAGAGSENWIIMEWREFRAFLQTPEGMKRRADFGRLEACGENDCTIIAECGIKKAREWKREENRHRYLANSEKKMIKYSSMCPQSISDEEFMLSETLEDPAARTEESVLAEIMGEKLRTAMNTLPDAERLLIREMYLEERPMSISEFAELTGRDRAYVRKLREKAFCELREMIG